MQSSSRKQHAKGSGKERKDIDTYGGQRQPQTADTEIFSPPMHSAALSKSTTYKS